LYVAEQAADPDSTLVIYMGLATLPGLAAKLMANGLPADTPAVAIERGTTAQQRVVRTCTKYAIMFGFFSFFVFPFFLNWIQR
jgi:siroheme synthase